ncbi:YfiR family protein [Parasulfuritortus cantonensis]|uniref:YfiR family protein n=1 Tax=Parasulfuritortus cantonensis TaxID=2528202 RepID=A0A4R1B8Z5_9PROT|nr:YfiR family protein [Parasulfuritortus cantonensis]TCJ12953.1 YfiR family protein [Parasulfuritortus cantonensis]
MGIDREHAGEDGDAALQRGRGMRSGATGRGGAVTLLRRCLRPALLLATLLAGGMGGAGAQERAESEDAVLVKVAFVYNFAKFSRWPDSALGQPGAPLTLCVAGDDETAAALGQLQGKPVKGRPLAVEKLRPGRPARACQLLYVATSEQGRQAELLRAAGGQPVLTVSELPRFASQGGMIELAHPGGHPRFVINLAAVRGAGLEISPNLLALAQVLGQD